MRLLQNIHIIDSQSPWHQKKGSLLFSDKFEAFLELGEVLPEDIQERIDGQGGYFSPSLTDLHFRVHSSSPLQSEKLVKDIEAALAGGIGSFCCPPDSLEVLDTADSLVSLELFLQKAQQPIEVHPLAALTRGLQSETLSEMSIIKDRGFRHFSNGEKDIFSLATLDRVFRYAKSVGVHITYNCTSGDFSGHLHPSFHASRLGIKSIPSLAESVGVQKVLSVAEYVGIPVHISRISAKESVEIIRSFKAKGLAVTCDVAIHNLLLEAEKLEDFDITSKTHPPIRSTQDQNALLAGLAEGVVDAVVSNHNSWPRSAKKLPFDQVQSGISTADYFLSLLLKLVEEQKIQLEQAIELVTKNPRKLMGLPKRAISPGMPAHGIVYSMDAPYKLEVESLKAYGKYTPWLDKSFSARVLQHFRDGRVVNYEL